MSIEVYAMTMIRLYIGLILFFIVSGVVDIWNRIRKKTPKYWRGIIPCSILYLITAMFSTCAASIAYDDPADPNYARYAGWELRDFILHDIKTFIIWLLIGVLLYLVFEKLLVKRSIRTGCAILSGFLVIVLLMISFVHF